MESRSIDFAKTASIDLMSLNNKVVNMRPIVKRSKAQVVNKLSRNISALKKKKGTDAQKEKNIRKAERLIEDIESIRRLKEDKVSKYSLANTATFETISNSTLSSNMRALARLADHNLMSQTVKEFRENHSDWRDLAAFLLIKQTGRKFKTKKQKQKKLAQRVENINASETMTKVYIQDRFGKEGVAKAEERFDKKRKRSKKKAKENEEEENADAEKLEQDADRSISLGKENTSEKDDESIHDLNDEGVQHQKEGKEKGGEEEEAEEDKEKEVVEEEEDEAEVEEETEEEDMEEEVEEKEVEEEEEKEVTFNFNIKHKEEKNPISKRKENTKEEDQQLEEEDESEEGDANDEESDEEDESEEEDDESHEEDDENQMEAESEESEEDGDEAGVSGTMSGDGKVKPDKTAPLKSKKPSVRSRARDPECVVKELRIGESSGDDSDDGEISIDHSGESTGDDDSEEEANSQSGESGGSHSESDESDSEKPAKKRRAQREGKAKHKKAVPEFLTKEGTALKNTPKDPFFLGSDVEEEEEEDSHYRGKDFERDFDKDSDNEMGSSASGHRKSKSLFYAPGGEEFTRRRFEKRGSSSSFGFRGRGGFENRGRGRGGHSYFSKGKRVEVRGGFSGSDRRGSKFGGNSRPFSGRGSRGKGPRQEFGRPQQSAQSFGVPAKNDTKAAPTPSSSSTEKLHPSWEASRKRKSEQSGLKAFQGTKIVFNDD